MNKIHNLAEHDMLSCSARAGVPSDDRLVILQDNVDGEVQTIGARYRNGRWIGGAMHMDLTDQLTNEAIWAESFLFLPSSVANYGKEDAIQLVPLRPTSH
jgi:hypothetical protein